MIPTPDDAALNRAKTLVNAGQLSEAAAAYRKVHESGGSVAARGAGLIGLVETLRIIAISRSVMDAFRDEAELPPNAFRSLDAIDPATTQASGWNALCRLYPDVFATGAVSPTLAATLLVDLRAAGNGDAAKAFATGMPSNGPVAMFEAVTALRAGNYVDGDALLKRALQAMPHSVSGRRLQARERWRGGQGARATALFEIALALADDAYRGIRHTGPDPVILDEDFMGWRIGCAGPMFFAEHRDGTEEAGRLEAVDLDALFDAVENATGDAR